MRRNYNKGDQNKTVKKRGYVTLYFVYSVENDDSFVTKNLKKAETFYNELTCKNKRIMKEVYPSVSHVLNHEPLSVECVKTDIDLLNSL